MSLHIIAAAGPSSRWDNAMGIPKHLVPVHGEPLIHRTQRLFGSGMLLAFDDRYLLPGSGFFMTRPPNAADNILPGTAIGHSEHYWSRTETTLLLFGDVFFTEAARDTILSRTETTEEILFFGHPGGSDAKKYRELFAIAIPASKIVDMIKASKFVRRWRELHGPSNVGGWFVLLRLQRRPMEFALLDRPDVLTPNRFVSICDGTDDFDYPEEYHRWIEKHGSQ